MYFKNVYIFTYFDMPILKTMNDVHKVWSNIFEVLLYVRVRKGEVKFLRSTLSLHTMGFPRLDVGLRCPVVDYMQPLFTSEGDQWRLSPKESKWTRWRFVSRDLRYFTC